MTDDQFSSLLTEKLAKTKEQTVYKTIYARNVKKPLSEQTTEELMITLTHHMLDDQKDEENRILNYFKQNRVDGSALSKMLMSKKQFINEILNYGDNRKNNNIKMGTLMRFFANVKEFNDKKLQISEDDNSEAIQQLFLLFDCVKKKIRERLKLPELELTKSLSYSESVYSQSEHWASFIWRKYHQKYQEEYQDTMTKLLWQNAIMAEYFEKRFEMKLRVKTILAYYDINKSIIPAFEVLMDECDIILEMDDVKLRELKRIYDLARYKVQHDKEEKANQMKKLLKRLSRSQSNLSEANKSVSQLSVSGSSESDDLIADNHILYDNGLFMRYKILNPMYESLAEECIMNSSYNITAFAFNKLLSKAKKIYEKKSNCIATMKSRSYGILKYEPIKIQHIMAIIMYTDETQYSQQLTMSYLSYNTEKELIKRFHSNNFYWFGRFLFEAIEFFGERFDENSEYKLFQGSSQTFKFNQFGYPINFPRSTTPSISTALHFSGDSGYVLELIPRYKNVLNNTKFIDLSKMLPGCPEERLFFGRGCFVQIRNIMIKKKDMQRLMIPILYFEQILQQTIFDSRFSNSAHLYHTKYQVMQKTLLKLMKLCIQLNAQQNVSRDIKLLMIEKYFGKSQDSLEQEGILYMVQLLQHWCLNRTFVTFETFPSEIPYMIDELQSFFVTRSYTNYSININNVCKLLPNLKYYKDCYHEVVYLDIYGQLELLDIMNKNLGKYYEEVNDETYYVDENKVGKFKLWCKLQMLDSETVEQELDADPDECMLCDFDEDKFPFKVGVKVRFHERTRYIHSILKECMKKNMNMTDIDMIFSSNYRQLSVGEDRDDDNIIIRINNNLALYYKSVGNNSYYQYKDDDKNDNDTDSFSVDILSEGKFLIWCKDNNYDEKMVEEELKANDGENCELCKFDKKFPLKMHTIGKKQRLNQIYNILQKCQSLQDIRGYLNEYQSVFRVLPNVARHEVADHIVDALEAIQFNFIDHDKKDAMLTKLFEKKLKRLNLPIGSIDKIEPFIKALKSIGISHIAAADIFYKLSPTSGHEEKSSFDINADKKEIVQQIMTALKEQQDEFKYLAININEYKKVFAIMFKDKLDKFYDPISKLGNARMEDFKNVAKEIKLFEKNIQDKLCNYLFNKLFYDIEHIKPWQCKYCSFSNRKMMVGGLWRLYNQLNQCGLCGHSRYGESAKLSQQSEVEMKNIVESKDENSLLHKHISELNVYWIKVSASKHFKSKECNHKSKKSNINQMYLDGLNVNNVISLIENCINKWDDQDKHSKTLNNIKKNLIEWCSNNKMDGNSLIGLGRKHFGPNVIKCLEHENKKKIATSITEII
eukprot:545196_1